jgi:hypothetical protein
MSQPVLYQGVWWFRHPDGAMSWYDAASRQWVLYQQPAPARRFDRLEGLATWTVRAIVFDAIVSGIGAALALSQFFGIGADEIIRFEDLAGSGMFVTTQLIGTVGYLSGILFAAWFYRAYQNVGALNAHGRYAPGWAIGAWIVPIVNVFRPKQIANDIWRTSDPTLPEQPGTTWMSSRLDPLLGWWWGSWLLAGTVALVAFPIAFISMASQGSFETPSGDPSFTPFVRSFAIVFATSYAGRTLAAFFAVPVVKRMTERQTSRAAQLGVLPPD